MSSGRSVEGAAGGDAVGRGLAVGVAVAAVARRARGVAGVRRGGSIRGRCRLVMRSIWCGCWIGSVGWLRRRRRRRRVGWRSRRCGRRRVIVRRRTGWPRRRASVWVRRSSCWRPRRSWRRRRWWTRRSSAGVVSPRQARAAARAEAAQPGAGARLVAKAGSVSVTELETDANRIVAAASSETPEAKAERHRKARRVFHGVDADGMGWGRWRAPIAEHTRLVALLEAEQQKVFAEARARGDREPIGGLRRRRVLPDRRPRRPQDRAGAPTRRGRRLRSCGWRRRGGRGLVVHEDDRPGRPRPPSTAVPWRRVRCARSPGRARSRSRMRGG